MWTLGIDIGKNTHNAALKDQTGKTVFKNFKFRQDSEGFDRLIERLRQHGLAPDELLVGMEATGHYWLKPYETLRDFGYEALVLNPLMTAARRNVGIRGSKTDSADGELIAGLLREADLRISAVPDEEVRDLRNLCRLRFEASKMVRSEKHRIRGLLDQAFPEYADHFHDLLGAASRALLAEYPTANDLAKADVRRLTSILEKKSRGRMGRQKAEKLKKEAKKSFCLNGPLEALGLEIQVVLQRVNLLVDQIKMLDRKIKNFVPEEQELLKTIPGVKDVWAPTILGEAKPFFHPERKNGARTLVAAAGLDVSESQSGQKNGAAKMSKRGSKYLRTAVMQAAEVAALTAKDPKFNGVYRKQIEKGKPHKVALSHVANKMLHVVFSVLKNRRPYQVMAAQ
jgi:transposase